MRITREKRNTEVKLENNIAIGYLCFEVANDKGETVRINFDSLKEYKQFFVELHNKIKASNVLNLQL